MAQKGRSNKSGLRVVYQQRAAVVKGQPAFRRVNKGQIEIRPCEISNIL
jgi:hypothetical protein